MAEQDCERESLKDRAEHVEEEARMVLPGIQALFGFQLIAVFNPSFADRLSQGEQLLHWLALCLSAVAIMLSLAPAAYHRIAEPGFLTVRFVRLAGLWLCLAMIPLMLAICLDLYLIGGLITHTSWLSALVSSVLGAAYLTFWFIYPFTERRRNLTLS